MMPPSWQQLKEEHHRVYACRQGFWAHSKTKVMAVVREVIAEDRTPLSVGEEEVESVNEFPYLGSQIECSGRVMLDVERWIAQASKAFGALRKSVLLDHT